MPGGGIAQVGRRRVNRPYRSPERKTLIMISKFFHGQKRAILEWWCCWWYCVWLGWAIKRLGLWIIKTKGSVSASETVLELGRYWGGIGKALGRCWERSGAWLPRCRHSSCSLREWAHKNSRECEEEYPAQPRLFLFYISLFILIYSYIFFDCCETVWELLWELVWELLWEWEILPVV